MRLSLTPPLFWLAAALLALISCRAPSPELASLSSTHPESHSLYLDIAHAGPRLIAVGEAGRIVFSDDQGHRWQLAQTPSDALLTAVYFVDARHGWAVGHDMLILATTDGGLHWTKQFDSPQESRPLLDVWFADLAHGYAVGAYGAMLSTRDGGTHWEAHHLTEDDHHLYAILGQPDGSLLIAGEAGTLKRSSDNGATWTAIPSPYPGSFFGLIQARDGGLVAFGLRGHIARSTDRGLHWEDAQSPVQASLMGGTILNDGRLMIAGAAGTLLQSSDQGRTFSVLKGGGHHAWSNVIDSTDGLLLTGETGIEPWSQ